MKGEQIMDNEVLGNVVETVSQQPEVVNSVVESSKGLPNWSYVGIGAGGTLLGVGLGWLLYAKVINPAIQKAKAKKAETKAAENKAEDQNNEEETEKEKK